MIHAREDYNRFQDPALEDPSLLGKGSSPIAEDEPVMLFRAKDEYFIPVLEAYWQLLADDADVSEEMISAVRRQIDRASTWQHENGSKTPDMPDNVQEGG